VDQDLFDRLTRGLGRGMPRRRISELAAGALAALGVASAEAGKKKKKKKKKSPQPLPAACVVSCAGKPCGASDDCGGVCGAGSCPTGLTCGDNGCPPSGPVCCGAAGAGCAVSCDCCDELFCSDRQGDICANCATTQAPCATIDDCCFNDNICGDSVCATDRCCGQAGAFCTLTCDCCTGFGCNTSINECEAL